MEARDFSASEGLVLVVDAEEGSLTPEGVRDDNVRRAGRYGFDEAGALGLAAGEGA